VVKIKVPLGSVQDLDPDNPFYFGPSGSASRYVIYLYGSGSGSFYQQAKNEEKP
jgi:hypothetical protein